MTLRIWNRGTDYPMLETWWHGHGWPPVPVGMLPTLGVIVTVKDRDTAAGWLYMDNSVGVSMLEWIVTNPAVKGSAGPRAIAELTRYLTEEAKRMDYGVTLTTTRLPSLSRLLTRSGFTETDRQMLHLVRLN